MDEELCSEMENFIEWYNKEIMPEINKILVHCVECPQCQKFWLDLKDQWALEMLLMSDEEAMRRIKREDKGNEFLYL